MPRQWRLTSSLLLLWMLALGTGAAEALHNLEHERRATAASNRHAGHDDHAPGRPDAPASDYGGCAIHAQLHAPMLAGEAAEPALPVGVLGLALISTPPSLCIRELTIRLGCRGPPPF